MLFPELMTGKFLLTFLITSFLHLFPTNQPTSKQNLAVLKFLEEHNKTATEFSRLESVLSWKHATGRSFADEEELIKMPSVDWDEFLLNQSILAGQLGEKFEKTQNLGKTEKRLLWIIRNKASSSKDIVVRRLHQRLSSELYKIFLSARVRLSNGRVLASLGDISDFFAASSDSKALSEAWRKWRDQTGKKMRQSYSNFVRVLNVGARENGFSDYGFFEFFSDFEDSNFPSKVATLMSEVRPLFLELHAFVRWKLSQKYKGHVNISGPMPAHLLGSPWAMTWIHLFPLVRPYPVGDLDITATLKRQNWTTFRMLKTAEQFFTSLGLPPLTTKFWERSQFEKVPDIPNYDCHGSAWDFSAPGDVRISMCVKPSWRHLRIVHHEMGHMHYYMAYSLLPYDFRDGANSAFHEAIGDTIILSVLTPQYLQKIGLMPASAPINQEMDLNFLMRIALNKVVFLPYALSIDAWRWGVFDGRFPEARWNSEWWRLRRELQGVEPPVRRTEADLDAAAKYHVAINSPYIRYFVSSVLQFQFFEALCKASGHSGPIHRCNIHGSKSAGQLMKKMMALGRSKPWPLVLEVMTGHREMKTGSLRRYFAPLEEWLKKRRREISYPLGW